MSRTDLSRRRVLGAGLGSLLVAACPRDRGAARHDARPMKLVPTPAVHDDDPAPSPSCAPTADNIEGPFFKAGAPHRAVLVTDRDPGERLIVGGVVRSTSCAPLTGAELELWHADASGAYDLDGYRFRATLQPRADGAWQLSTIVPGRYLNGDRYRPAHIHAKVRAPGHRELTTQLYFDGDPYNDGDPFIAPSLIMAHRVERGVRRAGFDFVLQAG